MACNTSCKLSEITEHHLTIPYFSSPFFTVVKENEEGLFFRLLLHREKIASFLFL